MLVVQLRGISLNLPHAIVLAGISMLLFAACGGDGADEPSPTATASETASASASETPASSTPTREASQTPTPATTPVPPDPDLVVHLARSASYIIGIV